MKRLLLIAGAVTAWAAPALAGDVDPMGNAARARHDRVGPLPAQLDPAQRTAVSAILTDLDAANWTGAETRIAALPTAPLKDYLRAELLTRPRSPEAQVPALLELLGRSPELPQAATLADLARRRGATAVPGLPAQQRLVGLGGQPRRQRPRVVSGDALARELDGRIRQLLIDDKPAEAEAIVTPRLAELTVEGRTELLQKIAWTYYREGQPREALRAAANARAQGGDWAIHAEWYAGLSHWQVGEIDQAEAAFAKVARLTGDPELAAAGHYWASRAALRAGHPERVQSYLRSAAAGEETFYGLLAESTLGVRRRPAGDPHADGWALLARRPNLRTAIALSEAGQPRLADALLRHQARIGPADEHAAIVRLAGQLNLTATQMYLAHNGPAGARIARHDRYPAPDWRPDGGWRVDQALAYAHALQESNFRPDAVSGAGARGLMQVVPGTAGDLVRWGRVSGNPARLNDPETNLAFGQGYLSYLRDRPAMQGLLPRVIAAYNAGPAPSELWAAEGTGGGDPLLFMESIPYWETRGYVPIILRNYWMYEDVSADRSESRRALSQGLWPRFPGLPGPSAVRLTPGEATAQGSD